MSSSQILPTDIMGLVSAAIWKTLEKSLPTDSSRRLSAFWPRLEIVPPSPYEELLASPTARRLCKSITKAITGGTNMDNGARAERHLELQVAPCVARARQEEPVHFARVKEADRRKGSF